MKMRSALNEPFRILGLPALLALIFVWACNLSDATEDQYLAWHLSETLKEYARVEINLVDPNDSAIVYEKVWDAPIPQPSLFPKYKLGPAKGKDFTIRIRCFNAKGDLVQATDVGVIGTGQKASTPVVSDTRIRGLKISSGTLSPAFDPDGGEFSATVDSALAGIILTIQPMDASYNLAINGKAADWNSAISQPLHAGANVFTVDVVHRDGRTARSYRVTLVRGGEITEVKRVGVSPKDTTLYVGDATLAVLRGETDPVGARMQWTSDNESVARVDGNGKITSVEAGEAHITVKAGNLIDVALVRLKRDAPQISAGGNVAVAVGAEVVFPISIQQERGTIASFKYDLDGDSAWDNPDTTILPSQLKHTYAKPGRFTARFYAKDSEGNPGEATRTITVSSGKLLMAITWPGRDTTVAVTPILIRYDVNGTHLTRSVDLQEGPKRVVIDTTVDGQKDSAFIHITLDTTPPKAPEVAAASFAGPFRPTWTWSGSEPEPQSFRIRLDNPILDSSASTTGKTFTPASNLGAGEHVLYVQERDKAGNWSKSGKFAVTLAATDTTPPLPPKITGTSPTNSAPKWAWRNGGGDGTGFFKFKLDDSTLAGAMESKEIEFTLKDAPVSGRTYVLWVAERDAGGLWSKPSSLSILYDATKPSVAITSPQPSGTYITKAATLAFAGLASGPNPIVKVTYAVNGGATADAVYSNGNWSVAAVNLADNAITSLTFSALDNAGNHGEATLLVLRDNLPPAPPTLVSSPPTPSNALKGTWAWNAGADAAGSSGLSGRFRYSLDGGATWTDTTVTVAKDLPLPEGATVLFSVQEQDLAGNWSLSASNVIAVDRSAPKVAVTTPASGGTQTGVHVTLTGTVSDVGGAGVASVVVSGMKSGPPNGTVAGATWFSGDLILKAGLDTLTITATDNVGNIAAIPWTVTVNPAVPAVSISSPLHGFATNLDTVRVKYKVDAGAPMDTLVALVKDGANLLTIYSPKSEAGLTGSDTLTVIRDKTGPGIPTVSPSGRTVSRVDPAWTFTSGGDNAGGSGVSPNWNYKLTNAANVVVASGLLTTTAYTYSGAGEGEYTFSVQQQDKAGNCGPYSALSTVVVDKTPNKVAVSSPANNFVTNQANISLVCVRNDTVQAAQPVILNSGKPDGANTLTCDYSDPAGNPASASVTVYYQPNVYFVKAGSLDGDGSTWAKAFGTIPQALAAVQSGATKQIWVASGTYNKEPGSFSLLALKSNLSLYGGFNPATAKAVTDRTFGPQDTTQSSYTWSIKGTSAASPIVNVTFDGFKITHSEGGNVFNIAFATGITLKNLQFNKPIQYSLSTAIIGEEAAILIDNCLFTNFAANYYIIDGRANANFTINNSVFTKNLLPGDPAQSYIRLSGPTQSFTNTQFLDYPGTTGDVAYTSATGKLDLTNCTFRASAKDVALVVWSLSPDVTVTSPTWLTP